MSAEPQPYCTAFEGPRLDRGSDLPILVFDVEGYAVELDLRGTLDDVEQRYASTRPGPGLRRPEALAKPGRRGPGRPKLGVVGREVTLLPRHWAWLGEQRGGRGGSTPPASGCDLSVHGCHGGERAGLRRGHQGPLCW